MEKCLTSLIFLLTTTIYAIFSMSRRRLNQAQLSALFLLYQAGPIKKILPTMEHYTVTFSKEELARYNRHIIIPEFGLEAQQKLKAAKVLIVGSGGLGSPALLYLAAAG